MTCPNCGNEVNGSFCNVCGQSLFGLVSVAPQQNQTNDSNNNKDKDKKNKNKNKNKNKTKQCSACGNTISVKAKKCPACGERNKRPLKYRGWFRFMVVVFSLVLVISLINPVSQLFVYFSGADGKSIELAVNQIEAGEFKEAYSTCNQFDSSTLYAGNDKILNAVKKKLNSYLATGSWINTSYALVDSNTINELKSLKKIVSLLPDTSESNALSFLNTAMRLEYYTVWNEYHSSNQDAFEEMMNYMNTGAQYRYSSPSITEAYYQKALSVANTSYNSYSGRSGKGMQEAADFYYEFIVQLEGILYDNDTSSNESSYNNAMSAYEQIMGEYIDDLDEVVNIVRSFPSLIY